MPQKRRTNAPKTNKGRSQGRAAEARGKAQRASAPAVPGSARNDIAGVVLAVVSIAMLVALVAPTSAVVTHATAQVLTLCFGVGAILCPVALFLFSLTFFVESEGPLGERAALGLLLIVLALLSMISVNVHGAAAGPSLVLDPAVVPHAGGYVGGLIAWLLLTFLGQIVGNVVLVGAIVAGVVVCGFSISGLVEHVQEAARSARESHALRRAAAEAERAASAEEEAAAAPEDAAPRRRGTAEGDTTFIGSRKTSVLTRKAKSKAQPEVEGTAKGKQSQIQDALKTVKLKRRPKVEEALVDAPATAGADASDAAAPGASAGVATADGTDAPDGEASKRTTRLKRGPHGRRRADAAGAAGAKKVAQPANAAGAAAAAAGDPAVPDFLRNPKARGARGAKAPAAADAVGQAQEAAPEGVAAAATVAAAAQGAVRPGDGDGEYELPPLAMLSSNPNSSGSASSKAELDETREELQSTLQEFGLRSRVVDYVSGPMVTTFRVEMGEGERVSRIKNLEDDIALTLAAEKVRIFAPIKGTSYVGIEIPNKTRENVYLGDVLPYAKGGPLEVAVGRDSGGKPVVADLAKMPHMLVAGTTGSGKSVMINSMIMSILMRTTPKQVRLILVDPKRVEFSCYNGLPHLYVPVVTEPRQAASALQWAVSEMERRLKVFERAGARNIKVYNRMCTTGKLSEMDNPPEPMPYLVIIIDELSDLMMVAGKDVEASIVRIAQLARAAGIHLIIATQRPSANVVTGLIKSNIDTRAALKVSSGLDSRVILDETGAERLLGNGDMLFKNRGLTPQRVLGCFTTDAEINAVVDYIRSQAEPDYHEEILTAVAPNTPGGGPAADLEDDDDPLVWEAAQIVVETQLGSTSGLQRKLKVGYARAGRIMDMLESKGVVGPPDGSKPREVLLDEDQLEELRVQEAKYQGV
ncbi:MAG: DNA translocase FtsK 4TM domain-containing protein [Olsenella sp.]|jgi:S-DNA-T family DNA segregation ATPase FtsK/SpoIIIE